MNLVQSYAIFRPIANFLAFISPTCSDNWPPRRQIKVFHPECVANSINFAVHIYFHKPCENYFLLKNLIILEKSCIFAKSNE